MPEAIDGRASTDLNDVLRTYGLNGLAEALKSTIKMEIKWLWLNLLRAQSQGIRKYIQDVPMLRHIYKLMVYHKQMMIFYVW